MPLHFTGNFEKSNATIRVNDHAGQLVLEQKAEIYPGEKRELPVEYLPAGLYRVTVWIENGGVRSRPVVVARE